MGVEEEVEKKFTKFVEFCKGVLGKDGEQIMVLIKKRKNECSARFLQSTDMLSLIKSTKTSMKTEPKRNIVHLKDFLNELKAYRNKKKRKSKDEAGDRVAKLRKLDGNCSEASTDGTVSDAESCNKVTHELKSEDSNDSVCILDNNIINSTGDCKTDDIVLPVISSKTTGTTGSTSVTTTDMSTTSAVNTAGTTSENISINKTDDALASVQSADDDSDVVMIADDDDEDAVKVNGIGDESCVIIEDDTPTEASEGQKSLLSMLNLQRKPLINGNLDDDVIICDSSKPKQTITNIPFSDIPELKLKPNKSSKSEEGSKSKVKVDKASCSKSEEVKENDGEKKKADKTDKHIKRLEALLEKLKNKIEELREQELSLEDLDDDMSSYIYEDKLERKFVTVWNKLCQIKGRNKTTGRPAERVFNYSGTRYEEMNKKLERLINKHKEFPDFHDVKNVIKKVNTKSSLGLSASQVDSIAREAFLDVGNMLQERRHKDFMCTFKCRVQDNFSFERDPALFDVELQRKLENNRIQGKDKLEEVINKFADKQIYDDDGDEDQGGEEGGEKKEKEGGETSQDDEEDEDDDDDEEVVEDIEDVDQFVDATEILANYTPSRPAISVNPKLANFHARTEGESRLNADKEEGHGIDKEDSLEGGHAQAHQNGEVDKHKSGTEKDSKESKGIGSKKQNDSDAPGQDTSEDQDVMTDSSAIEIREVEDMVTDGGKDTDDDIVIVSADSEDEILKNGGSVEIKPSNSAANSSKKMTDNHSAEFISSTISENINGRSPQNVSTKSKRIAPTPISSSFMAEISNDDKAELTAAGSDLVDSDVCLINLDNEVDVPTSGKTDKMDVDEGKKVESKINADVLEETAKKPKTHDGILSEFIKSVGELDKSNNCDAEESITDQAEDQCLDGAGSVENKTNSKEDLNDTGSSVIDISDAVEANSEPMEDNSKNNASPRKNSDSSESKAQSKVASPKQDKVIGISDSAKDTVKSKEASPKQDDASDVMDLTEPTTESKKIDAKKNTGSDDNNDSSPTKNQSKEANPKQNSASDVMDLTESTMVATESKTASPKKNTGSDDTNASSPTGAKNQSKAASTEQDKVPVITDITESTKFATEKVSPKKNVGSDTSNSTETKENADISDAVETTKSKDPEADPMDITDSTEDVTIGNPKKDVVSNIKSASVDNLDSNDSLKPDQDVPKGQTENKNGGTDLKSNKSNIHFSGSSSSQENKSIYICDDNTPDNQALDSCSNSDVKTVESLSNKDSQEKPDSPLVDGSASDSHEVCDISDDSQSVTSDINDNDTEITEKRDDLESNSCDVDSQASSSRKPLLVRDFSEDSQSNDCQVIDQPDSECVLIDDDFECDSSIKLEKCGPKTLKLPEFLNTQNPLSIRNRMTNLFNMAKINVGKTSKTLNSNNENRAKTCGSKPSSEQYSCSQVSTSSKNSAVSPRKMSRHLPTTSLKKTSVHVDSFLIEIDEADIDCVTNSMEVEEDSVCQSTTEEFSNEVSSSMCDPDVIILSDSD